MSEDGVNARDEQTLWAAGEATLAEVYGDGEPFEWRPEPPVRLPGKLKTRWTMPHLPRVECHDRQLRDVTAEALAALVAANDPPVLYQQGRSLVRVHRGRSGPAVLQPVEPVALRAILARCANWVATRDRHVTQIPPPHEVVQDLLGLEEWPGLPPIAGVVNAPCLAASGELVTAAGYHRATQLYHDPGAEAPAVVPAHPDAAAVRTARELIMRDLLGEFPFVDEAGRAHAAALLLLPFVREAIDGPTPLHLIDAPAPGSGKGLLAQVAAGLFAGSALAPQTVAQTADEWRKRLTACFARGASHLWLDNVDRKLDSGELAAALTATSWTDRFLGSSRLLEAPVRTVWLATGNNVRLSEELARRTLWIRLDSGRARPWERDGFRHPDLLGWARGERPRLLAAALTLVQAWVAAGRPAGEATLGSFESWAAVMSGLLAVAGIPGLLQNTAALYEQVEDEEADWTALVERWAAVQGERPVGVSEIYALLAGSELLAEALDEGGDRARKTRLGILLSARHGRIYGAWRIVRAGRKQNAAQYRLIRCEGKGP